VLRVARHVSALLVLAGCDIAFGIDPVDQTPTLCGPYGPPEPVAFDAALGSPTDFSVAKDGIHGLVRATVGAVGPTPIVYDESTATWVVDNVRNAGIMLQLGLSGGHMGETGDVYGWIAYVQGGQSSLQHYIYSTTSMLWSATTNELGPGSTTFDLASGQEIEIPDDESNPTAYARFLAEVKLPTNGEPVHSFDILVEDFGTTFFLSSGFATELDNDVALDINGAAMTAKHHILVYSAILAPDTESHLYETEFTRNHFTIGTPMRSLMLAGHPDDQPWVNEDCSTIWFHRDNAVWTAHKL
jgi:hypothetical protein